MRFDEDSQAFVIDDDTAFPVRFYINETHTIPPYGRHTEPLNIETRVVRGTFENRWSVSIIWGSMTYCVNKDHPYGDWRGNDPASFQNEPSSVEVGIIMPEPVHYPAQKIGLPDWKGPEEWPTRTIELWGDPLGWVTAPQLKWLLQAVSQFDSHEYNPHVEEGPYLDVDDQGRFMLNVTFKDLAEQTENEKEQADAD